MKRKISALLIMLIIISMVVIPVHVNAWGQIVTPLWDNVNIVTSSLSFLERTGKVDIKIYGDIDVSNITATVNLYYKNSNGNWVEIRKDWEYDEDQFNLFICETFTGVTGREYRIELQGLVTQNGYTETITDSATATCP